MRWSLGAGIAAFVCLAHVGAAQTLQVGNTNPGDPGNAWEMSEYAQAQAFHTTDAFTATSVSFWTQYGGYTYPGPAVPADGTSGVFDWAIYGDNGGTPGIVISSGSSDQVSTGIYDSRVQWTIALPNVPLDAASEYWFGIRNTGASGTYTFTNLYWTADISGTYTNPGSQYYNPTTGQWTPNPATDDAGFGYGNHLTLAIYGNPTTSTTPEPSTLALIGTGLIGFVPMVRRKRAKAL